MDKKEERIKYERMTLMYMVLGQNSMGTTKMWYVKASSEEEAWDAAEEFGLKVSNIMTFSHFTQHYKIDFVPEKLRPRQRKSKKRVRKSD